MLVFRHHGACLNSGGVFFFASMKLVEDHFSGASVFACPPMLACGEMHRKEMLPLLPGPILAHRGLLVWALMQSLIAIVLSEDKN